MANYSGLWDRQYGVPYTQLFNTAEFNKTEAMRVAKSFRSKGQRPLARLIYTLTGAASGATATESLAQLTSAQGIGDPLSNGGRRTVAPVVLLNRATTAADITLIQGLLTQIFGPIVNSGYPTDVSRNGGGGKISAANGSYGF